MRVSFSFCEKAIRRRHSGSEKPREEDRFADLAKRQAHSRDSLVTSHPPNTFSPCHSPLPQSVIVSLLHLDLKRLPTPDGEPGLVLRHEGLAVGLDVASFGVGHDLLAERGELGHLDSPDS